MSTGANRGWWLCCGIFSFVDVVSHVQTIRDGKNAYEITCWMNDWYNLNNCQFDILLLANIGWDGNGILHMEPCKPLTQTNTSG